jgi:hypothetical protein
MCSPWKDGINDFLHSETGRRNSNVFHVLTNDINQDVLGIAIWGTHDRIAVVAEESASYSYRGLPTGYIETKGKLFYWSDPTKHPTPSDSLISVLRRINLLDTAILNVYIPESIIDDSQHAFHYYFCKSNQRLIRKLEQSAPWLASLLQE